MSTDMSAAITLTVSEVRAELRKAAGAFASTSNTNTSLPVVGTIFHESVAEFRWQEELDDSRLLAPDAPTRLARRMYRDSLRPRLDQRYAALAAHGAEVLDLWAAVQAYCRWLVDVLRAAATKGLLRFDQERQEWLGVDAIFAAEMPLRWNIPHTNPPVILEGEADALWRDPWNQRWCVLQYKLGCGSPELDLAQACLYQQLLKGSQQLDQSPMVCLLRFNPDLEPLLFPADSIAAAEERLLRFITTLAASRRVQPSENAQEFASLGGELVRAFGSLGQKVQCSGTPIVGPSFVRFELKPLPPTKIKGIISRSEDVQIQLGWRHAPTIWVDQGKLVADVPREMRNTVLLSDVLNRRKPEPPTGLRLLLGVDVVGEAHWLNLADPISPHVLVAGGTGSGKSQWLLSALASITSQRTPDDVRLVLVDPKYTAFGAYAGSPFLLTPHSLVFPQDQPVVPILLALVDEMERRYVLFSRANNVSDLDSYNASTSKRLPRILFCCDEFADLMTTKDDRDALRECLMRLGAKARAAGIHLILATQSPRRDIVDGIIKANLPARVCLRVTSHIESSIVLGRPGAEKLLGNGDLYFSAAGDPIRLQGTLCDVPAQATIRVSP
jgi:hypothetical protein